MRRTNERENVSEHSDPLFHDCICIRCIMKVLWTMFNHGAGIQRPSSFRTSEMLWSTEEIQNYYHEQYHISIFNVKMSTLLTVNNFFF